MSRLLVGHIPAESLPREDGFKLGLDIKLEIDDDGTHKASVRPGRGDTFTGWPAPEVLVPESAEVE